MTRVARVARSFPLVCFSADAFNFYPVRCFDMRGETRECQKEEKKKGSDGALGEILIVTILGEYTATYSPIGHKKILPAVLIA